MRSNYLLSILTVLLLAILTACSKENDVTPANPAQEVALDNRTQIEGTYNYIATLHTVASDGSLVYMGSQVVGTLIAKKNTADADKIDFIDSGKIEFQANRIETTNNRFTFNIPSQIHTTDGSQLNIIGYEGITIGSSKYHGVYNTADKKITAYVKFKDSNAVRYFQATKVQ